MPRILTRGKSAYGEDPRLEALLTWVPVAVRDWEPVTGDASRRRYFRLHTSEGSLIVMDAPPPEAPQRFLQVAELLRAVGIRVPRIHAWDLNQGFVLLEDFGDRAYLDVLNGANAECLYGAALASLLQLQTRIDPSVCELPPYSQALLLQELEIFRDWLVERWLNLAVPASLWQDVTALLVDSALEQPQVCVHRDYHSRNLMFLADGNPGVLDFQDAVIGPVTYDPVSLLRDCYLAWPRENVAAWSERHRLALAEAGMRIAASRWQRWFDRMGVQRHLKAAGIFARLWLRDGRRGYLADIPRTLGYVVEVSREDLGLRPLGEFLERQVLPQVEML